MRARLVDATPVRNAERCGLVLSFQPDPSNAEIERIDDFADLGPELSVAAVIGLGKVVRILRAARIAVAGDSQALIGREAHAAALLRRARATPLELTLRPRSRIRFVAWTEGGIETVDDVSEVLESLDTVFVIRRDGRYPVRIPREAMVRYRTEVERWFEVTAIGRA